MPAEKLKIEIVHSANHHQLGGAKNDNLHAPRTGHRHQQKKPKPLAFTRNFDFLPYSSRPDSNRRPTHYECVALPTEPYWQNVLVYNTKTDSENQLFFHKIYIKKRLTFHMDSVE